MKKIILAILFLSMLTAFGCTESEKDVEEVKKIEEQDKKTEEIEIKNGNILNRDIIPKLAKIYKIEEDEIKSSFKKAKSILINEEIEDFRKMEGIIIPGKYELKEDIDEQRDEFIRMAEERYKKIEGEVIDKNNLTEKERITLASIIEAEALGGEYYQEIADVFLNRLSEGSKLQSCVTAEYALGYQRPYLTFKDTEIESKYNTYYSEGLPIGPISSFSDQSLEKAIGKSTDESLNYFFYDYVLGDMLFFSDFEEFNNRGMETMERFKNESKVGEFDKINKQELYGK